MIGETLGQYRIEARLGSGGMGVVYRARDERLHRTVAIKVVGGGTGVTTPAERARLLDEARAASHLAHPHICTVYEVGEIEGRPFIAMEYIDGRPLAELIPPGGLPVETVVRYGGQIAAALAHAHERGVVHRDLKSANVVVSEQGGAKVLDFGLAHRVQVGDAEGSTRTIEIGEAALRAGTLAYAAPEVLLGQAVDARSDIWALGVVLYELATGDLPFKGRNQYDLTAAILRSPPQPLPAHVPPMLRAIIQRCIAKEPGQRYQRAGEARAALEALQSDVTSVPVVETARRRGMLAIGAGAAAVVGLGTALWLIFRSPASDWERTASNGELTQVISSEHRTFDPTISPDGKVLCFAVQNAAARVDLYTRRIAGGARIQLTDDEAHEESPRFSPDGERIAFTRRDAPEGMPEIRVMPALGGELISTIPRATSPAWSPDGRQLASIRRAQDGVAELTVSAPDGDGARTLLRGDSSYPFLRNPAWSPDARSIVVVRGTGGIAGELWIVAAGGGAARRLMDESASVFVDWPVYTPDGRGIVHASNRGGATNIWYLPLGGSAPIRLTTGPGPDESPSVAGDGTITFVNSRWRNTLDVHDLARRSTRNLATHSAFIWAPAVSPDGLEVAFSRSEVDGSWHIWTVPLAGGEARRLTATDGGEVYPRYSADGAYVFFHTWNTPRRIGRVPRAGGPPALLPFPGDRSNAFADVASDGRIAFTRTESDAERIYVLPAGGGEARLLTTSPGTVAKWSPDGSLIAFAPDRGYSGGIFVIGADGTGERRLTAEGGWPVWWPDGNQIGYLAIGSRGNQEIRSVALDGSPPRTVESVRLVGSNHPFAVSPDGRTLVISNAVHMSDEIWLLQPRR